MIRSLTLLAACVLAVPAVAAPAPVPVAPAPLVAPSDLHSGTATIDDTNLPDGHLLIGLPLPAIWGTGASGVEGIVLTNPETGGQVPLIDGQDGLSVDISDDGSSVTVTAGSSWITFTLS